VSLYALALLHSCAATRPLLHRLIPFLAARVPLLRIKLLSFLSAATAEASHYVLKDAPEPHEVEDVEHSEQNDQIDPEEELPEGHAEQPHILGRQVVGPPNVVGDERVEDYPAKEEGEEEKHDVNLVHETVVLLEDKQELSVVQEESREFIDKQNVLQALRLFVACLPR